MLQKTSSEKKKKKKKKKACIDDLEKYCYMSILKVWKLFPKQEVSSFAVSDYAEDEAFYKGSSTLFTASTGNL